MQVKEDSEARRQLGALASILATGIIRHSRAKLAESSEISPHSAEPALEFPGQTALSVTTRVNSQRNTLGTGEAKNEH